MWANNRLGLYPLLRLVNRRRGRRLSYGDDVRHLSLHRRHLRTKWRRRNRSPSSRDRYAGF